MHIFMYSSNNNNLGIHFFMSGRGKYLMFFPFIRNSRRPSIYYSNIGLSFIKGGMSFLFGGDADRLAAGKLDQLRRGKTEHRPIAAGGGPYFPVGKQRFINKRFDGI